MTVAELISKLNQFDRSTEVWVDTEFGLKETEMMYSVVNGDIDTIVLTYADNEKDSTTIN